jgi:hypothetical protein
MGVRFQHDARSRFHSVTDTVQSHGEDEVSMPARVDHLARYRERTPTRKPLEQRVVDPVNLISRVWLSMARKPSIGACSQRACPACARRRPPRAHRR